MSLIGRIGKFARSPQGKKLMRQAQQMAQDPKTREKISEVRARFANKQTTNPQQPKPANPPTRQGGPPPGATS